MVVTSLTLTRCLEIRVVRTGFSLSLRGAARLASSTTTSGHARHETFGVRRDWFLCRAYGLGVRELYSSSFMFLGRRQCSEQPQKTCQAQRITLDP